MNIPFSRLTRRAILRSCLAISLVATAVPTRADNPPKFKDPEVTAAVQKLSDLFDLLGVAIKAQDTARMDEVGNKMDALAKEYPQVFTKNGKLLPGKATSEEIAAYQKWVAAEATSTGMAQIVTDERSTKSLAQAKQIGLALKVYSADNDGEYPKTLDVLTPTYMTAEALKKMLVSPFAPDEPVGYTYHVGLKDDADPKTILLEDKFAPKAVGKKIVVYLDNSGEVIK